MVNNSLITAVSKLQLILGYWYLQANWNIKTVLRASGWGGTVEQKGKACSKRFVHGKQQVCVLANGLKITTPVAEVFINTPCLDERHAIQCMEHPVYDVIIGNVLDTRHLFTPNHTISLQLNAVETRQRKINERSTLHQLSYRKKLWMNAIYPQTVRAVQKKLIITKYDLVTSDEPNDSIDTLYNDSGNNYKWSNCINLYPSKE